MEFNLAHYNAAVEHVNHHIMKTLYASDGIFLYTLLFIT